MADAERAKRRVGNHVIEEVSDGMVLGLGSGSTAAYAIRAIGERVGAGLDVVGVPSSHQSARVAREAGVPVRCLADVDGIDVSIDGADQVAGLDLIKGGGGAHTREKVIDAAAERFVVVVDDSKTVEALDLPVPLETLPEAWAFVERRIRQLGGDPTLRSAASTLGPSVTDNGNFILECDFGQLSEPGRVADALARIPGTVEHGLFLGMADAVYVGGADEVACYEAG